MALQKLMIFLFSSISAVLLTHNFYIKTILLTNNFCGKNENFNVCH